MFIDKQKISREYLDEITKVGNLFDTLGVPYCIAGDFSLLANNFKVSPDLAEFLTLKEKKVKILEILFKLGYVIHEIKDNVIRAKKSSSGGDLYFDILLGELKKGNYFFVYDGRDYVLKKEIFESERKEIMLYSKGKSFRGYFRPLDLESIYLLKMNSGKERDILDLEMIRSSGKIELDKLIELFKINGLV